MINAERNHEHWIRLKLGVLATEWSPVIKSTRSPKHLIRRRFELQINCDNSCVTSNNVRPNSVSPPLRLWHSPVDHSVTTTFLFRETGYSFVCYGFVCLPVQIDEPRHRSLVFSSIVFGIVLFILNLFCINFGSISNQFRINLESPRV